LLAFFSLFCLLRTPVIASEIIHQQTASTRKIQKISNKKMRRTKGKNNYLAQSKLMPTGNISSKYSELSLNFGESSHPLISRALQFQGTQYKPGGQSPDTGFDCSGYVRFIFKESFGQNLPRSAAEMTKLDEPIDLHNPQAGDLVFLIPAIGLTHTRPQGASYQITNN
jgi:cell wall-associated NlpC family hydrolase